MQGRFALIVLGGDSREVWIAGAGYVTEARALQDAEDMTCGEEVPPADLLVLCVDMTAQRVLWQRTYTRLAEGN